MVSSIRKKKMRRSRSQPKKTRRQSKRQSKRKSKKSPRNRSKKSRRSSTPKMKRYSMEWYNYQLYGKGNEFLTESQINKYKKRSISVKSEIAQLTSEAKLAAIRKQISTLRETPSKTDNDSIVDDFGFCTARNKNNCQNSPSCDWNPSMNNKNGLCKLKAKVYQDYGFQKFAGPDKNLRERETHQLGYGPQGFGYYNNAYANVWKLPPREVAAITMQAQTQTSKF